MMFFTDAYADKPRTQRGELEQEVRRLKMQYWSDPSDVELLDRIALLEDEITALDHQHRGAS